MTNNFITGSTGSADKLYFGSRESVPYGFRHYNLLSAIDDKVNLELENNSVSEIVVNRILTNISLNAINNLLSELSRILRPTGILKIHFIDAKNLFEQFNKQAINLELFNNIVFNSKSLIDKTSLISKLNNFSFDITGFEFEDSKSWDDYNCIISAKNNKKEDFSIPKYNNQTVKNDDSIFSGIDFNIPEKDDNDNSFDIDLFNEVVNTSKHPETLDYDLLAEVMDFELDSHNDYSADFSKGVYSDSEQNAEVDEFIDEVMNFRLEPEKPKEEIESIGKDELNSILHDIRNIKLNIPSVENKLNYDFNSSQSYQPEPILPVSNSNLSLRSNTNKVSSPPAINLVWEGSQFVYNPLALVNREICSALINYDVANVTIVPYESDDINFNKYDVHPGLLDNDIRNKKEVSDVVSRLPYAWIRHQNPPKIEPPKGAKWIIMQPWEYTQVRKDMLQTLSRADEVWVPSFHTRKAMIDSGIDFNKVQVIPNGINPDIFKPTGSKYFLPTRKKLKFLFVGGTIYRKGFDLLLKAFVNSFNKSDDVCLVVKDTGNDSFYKGLTSEEAINSARSKYDSPEIIYIKDKLTESQMASLYRACDIIVAPYRAESFCLPLLEGIACGLPAIATKGGASDDFLEEAFTKFISAEKVSIGDSLDGAQLTGNAFMLEPSIEELQDALLYYYSNPGNITSMGAVASAYARSKWTWNKSTIKILRRLDYLYGTRMSSIADESNQDSYDSTMVFGTAEHSYIEGNYNEAADLYMQAIKGDVPDRYKILGLHRITMTLINRGEVNAAYDVLESVRDLQFMHPDSRYLEVILNASLHKNIEALEILSPILDGWKDYKFDSTLGHHLDDLLVLTADLMFANNDIEAANSLYTTALSLNSKNPYACYGAGMCFKVSGILNHAKEMFQWALDIHPEFEQAQNELSMI